jgi:hypothetical protein
MVSSAAVVGIALGAIGLVLTPGPNMIYLVSRTLAQGRSAGLVSLLGVAAGFVAYLFGSAAGVTALFAVVPFLYDVVRLLGAGYLLWLAWQAVRSRKAVAVRGATTGAALAAPVVRHGPGHQPAQPQDRSAVRLAASAVHRSGPGPCRSRRDPAGSGSNGGSWPPFSGPWRCA